MPGSFEAAEQGPHRIAPIVDAWLGLTAEARDLAYGEPHAAAA
jgi:hypothetical protein